VKSRSRYAAGSARRQVDAGHVRRRRAIAIPASLALTVAAGLATGHLISATSRGRADGAGVTVHPVGEPGSPSPTAGSPAVRSTRIGRPPASSPPASRPPAASPPAASPRPVPSPAHKASSPDPRRTTGDPPGAPAPRTRRVFPASGTLPRPAFGSCGTWRYDGFTAWNRFVLVALVNDRTCAGPEPFPAWASHRWWERRWWPAER
jgi:hypothetical protein